MAAVSRTSFRCSFLGSATIHSPFRSHTPSPTTCPHGDGEPFLRSIADNGSSWRREHLPCSAGRFVRASLSCEHVCRQLPEASKSCRTICICCRARQNTEYGKMFGSHFQKNPNIMYSSRRHSHRTRTEMKGRRNNVQISRANSATWSCVRDTRQYSAVETRICGVAFHRNVGEQ